MKARDAAIVKRLAIAPASLQQLLHVMPEEPGFTDVDREVACRSAVMRLTVKKQIRAVDGGGWALA